VKPENKVYKKRREFIIIKIFCYKTKKRGLKLKKKKGERWGQNRIKKRWDYKYPFLLSFMTGEVTKRKGRENFQIFLHQA